MEGRVAIVTGAARGFGYATAARLLAEGARVALWDVDADRVRRAREELDGSHVEVVDVGDPDAVQAAADRTRAALGPVDALLNVAGVVEAAAPWEVTDESWERVLRINASGTFFCIRACLPDMRERRYGKIVNLGSLAAQQGRPSTTPAYPASKGAVLGLTVSLARHLGEYGICVNAINPGFIRTEIHDGFTDAELAPLTADIPLNRRGEPGRRGEPEDIANACLFLASSESDFISGAFLSVNGASRTG